MRLIQGDLVHYREENAGYFPAIITRVFELDKDGWPEIACVAFVCGFHGAAFEVKRAPHGNKAKQYITHDEYREMEDARLDAEFQRKNAAELAKLAKEIAAEGQAKAE